jgi:hypothetical protein
VKEEKGKEGKRKEGKRGRYKIFHPSNPKLSSFQSS